MKRVLSSASLALLSLVAAAAPCAAQGMLPPGAMGGGGPMMGAGPMGMPDPSRMSGIPRPDPEVPPGRLVVRVLRGDFAHPMVGQEITLDGPGGPRSAVVDQTDHAVFDGLVLGRGAYHISASDGKETVRSQPIEMPASPGVKIMLVFKPDLALQLKEHEGAAVVDPKLGAGTVEVSLVDGEDHPAGGFELHLAAAPMPAPGGAMNGEQPAEAAGDKGGEQVAVSDDKGVATFTSVPTGEALYQVSIKRDGYSGKSRPFRLDGPAGLHVGLRALKTVADLKMLSVGEKSHLLIEVKDDEVDVVENWVVKNHATDPFDAGKDGLRIPLAEGAQGGQLAGEAPAGFTVDGNVAVLRGSLPPGDTLLSFAFVLPRKDDEIEVVQKVPLVIEQLVAVTDRFDGMEVTGERLEKVERELSGRKFWVVSGPAVPMGGEIRLKLSGLPHRSTLERDLLVTLAGLILLWGVVAGARARGGPSHADLEARRGRLLDELLALDRAAAATDGESGKRKEGKKADRRREELLERLERIYRDLDRPDGMAEPVHDGDGGAVAAAASTRSRSA